MQVLAIQKDVSITAGNATNLPARQLLQRRQICNRETILKVGQQPNVACVVIQLGFTYSHILKQRFTRNPIATFASNRRKRAVYVALLLLDMGTILNLSRR